MGRTAGHRVSQRRTAGATITGRAERRKTDSLTPHAEMRSIPRRRTDPSTIASHCHSEASSTIRTPTSSMRAERDRPSAPTPAARRRSTASSTRTLASAVVSRGGTRVIFGSSRTWNTLTSASNRSARPMPKSTATWPDSNWSIASNSRSRIAAPPRRRFPSCSGAGGVNPSRAASRDGVVARAERRTTPGYSSNRTWNGGRRRVTIP